MSTQAQIEAIHKSVTVKAAVDQAFKAFTDEITTWWPLATHSYGGEKAKEAVFEGREGGRVYERQQDGTEADWAEVVAWEPPERFVLEWKICPSEVEVRFSYESEGVTRVDLEHRGWERAGENAEQTRENYSGGWDVVLGAFVSQSR
jgi:Activator of Hsp90 ATPase homolog 1-like protein